MCVSRRIEKFFCAKRAAAMAFDSMLLGLDARKVYEETLKPSATRERANCICTGNVGTENRREESPTRQRMSGKRTLLPWSLIEFYAMNDSHDSEKSYRQVYVKENPASYLVSDAEYALARAYSANDRKDDEARTRFARVAILLYAISLEGFINFVYEYSQVPASTWGNLSFKDKWLRAAPECLPCNGVQEIDGVVVYRPGDSIESFREDVEPFVSFLELKAFRNSAVHLKPQFVMVEHDEVDVHLHREEYYPVSGLPKLLQHCSIEHAEAARRIYQTMTKELDRQMKGTVLGLFKTEGGAWVESICSDEDSESE
jgi:hypothetical protein